jgi:hypothetical protein
MTARRKMDPPINEALSVTFVLLSDSSAPGPHRRDPGNGGIVLSGGEAVPAAGPGCVWTIGAGIQAGIRGGSGGDAAVRSGSGSRHSRVLLANSESPGHAAGVFFEAIGGAVTTPTMNLLAMSTQCEAKG